MENDDKAHQHVGLYIHDQSKANKENIVQGESMCFEHGFLVTLVSSCISSSLIYYNRMIVAPIGN